jgi:hypothetical protein
MFQKGDLVEIDCFGFRGIAIITGLTFHQSNKHYSFQPMEPCHIAIEDLWCLYKHIKLVSRA